MGIHSLKKNHYYARQEPFCHTKRNVLPVICPLNTGCTHSQIYQQKAYVMLSGMVTSLIISSKCTRTCTCMTRIRICQIELIVQFTSMNESGLSLPFWEYDTRSTSFTLASPYLAKTFCKDHWRLADWMYCTSHFSLFTTPQTKPKVKYSTLKYPHFRNIRASHHRLKSR